jgi:serine protease Do
MKRFQLVVTSGLLLTALACVPLTDGDELPTVTPDAATATPVPPGPAIELDERQIRQNLVRATVQIVALVEDGAQHQPIWHGSGSILTPDGLILTNAHVVTDPDPSYRPDALGVAITVRSDQEPDLMYLAEVRAIDLDIDLAVVQIVSDLSGRRVDLEQLDLAYVLVGDSDFLELGDELQILGYPSIGGETITFTEGVVSGFTRERGVDGRAYVKTDATIAGGNSGGLAATADGRMVAIPTQVGYGGAERFADCRYLADTNSDGVIDELDNCIPVGGFINALRPVNLAKPLIEQARLGLEVPTPAAPSVSAGEASFHNLVFSPDVTANDQPTQIVSRLPSGATSLYAFWDYEGMADGAIWEARWHHDGEHLEDGSFPPSAWQGGESGVNWWVSIYSPDGLDDGTYLLQLYVEDNLLAEGSIPVGGATSARSITNLVFAEEKRSDGSPANPTFLLPSGITDVYAFFDYAGMENGLDWSRAWYRDGERQLLAEDVWDEGVSGSTSIGITSDSPLVPGLYRLEISVEGALLAAAGFTIAGTQTEEAIGPVTFASGQDAQGRPVDAGEEFPSGLLELHIFFEYAGMRDGLSFGERWLLDGHEIAAFDAKWAEGPSGTFHDSIFRTSGEPLPDGVYVLELYVEEQLVRTATATIGTGAGAPTPTPKPGGLYVQGFIVDADTGQGIAGALYVVLVPGVDSDSWDGSQAQIYAAAEADATGYFELPLPMARGQSYSTLALADGYRPAAATEVSVGNEPSPLEVEIVLQKE